MNGKKITKAVYIRMPESEYAEFIRAYKSSDCRNKTAFVKKLLLGKPVKVLYRNRSLDDFIELAVQMRKELKLIVSKDSLSSMEKEALGRKIDSIEKHLIKVLDTCTQTSK
jgi:MobC-like protein